MSKKGPVIKDVNDFFDNLDKVQNNSDGFSAAAVESFWTFIEEGQFRVDRRLVEPELFYWLEPLYRITRTDLYSGKYKEGITMRKSSQMGASVWTILFMLWLCIDPQREVSIAVYWPTEKDLLDFVTERFNKMVESSPKMQTYFKDGAANNTRMKQIGGCVIYFRYVKGQAGTDSIPVDVIIGDEVRLMAAAEEIFDRIDYRMTQSKLALRVLLSTVGSPGDFMERNWGKSNQVKYFSLCENCDVHSIIHEDPLDRNPPKLFRGDEVWHYAEMEDIDPARIFEGVVLSDFEPSQFLLIEDEFTAHYKCPCCGEMIRDPQNGGYKQTRPGRGKMYGIEFAQILAPNVGPTKVWQKSFNKNKKEFYNNVLAKPYVDPQGRIVKPEHEKLVRRDELSWYTTNPGMECFLGADFRNQEMHVVVGGKWEDGRQQILHLEVYQGDQMFPRLQELLNQFVVERAIIDYAPYTVDTLKMAKLNEQTVFLAQYREGLEMIKFAQENSKSVARVDEDVRIRNTVLIDQVRSFKWSLYSFTAAEWLMPTDDLWQTPFIDRLGNRKEDGSDMAGEFFQHLMCPALEAIDPMVTNLSGETVKRTGDATERFIDASGFDPHFAHAFNYMVMAAYLGGGGMEIWRSKKKKEQGEESSPRGEKRKEQFQRCCGSCTHFLPERKYCMATGYETQAHLPPCPEGLYRKKRREV